MRNAESIRLRFLQSTFRSVPLSLPDSYPFRGVPPRTVIGTGSCNERIPKTLAHRDSVVPICGRFHVSERQPSHCRRHPAENRGGFGRAARDPRTIGPTVPPRRCAGRISAADRLPLRAGSRIAIGIGPLARVKWAMMAGRTLALHYLHGHGASGKVFELTGQRSFA